MHVHASAAQRCSDFQGPAHLAGGHAGVHRPAGRRRECAPTAWPCSPRPDTTCPTSSPCCSPGERSIFRARVPMPARPSATTAPECWRRSSTASLVLISFYIWYEAFHRLLNPVDVHARLMIWVAAAGVVMNGGIALLLMRGHRDINLRSAIVHEIGDTLSTAAVIAGGVAIALTGQRWIDPALSIGIGVMILWSSIGIIRESLNILLEGTPSGMELERIEAHPRHPRRQRRPRPARLEHWQRHPFALLPRQHRRHARLGEREPAAPDSRRTGVALPHSSHHHPVRARDLRSRPRLRHSRQPRT